MRKSYARFVEHKVLSVIPLRGFAFRAARFAVLCCLVSLAAPLRAGNIYYASPTGSSSGDGSEEKPYDIATAVSKLAHYNYDEIRLLPGRYDLGAQILIDAWALDSYDEGSVVCWP